MYSTSVSGIALITVKTVGYISGSLVLVDSVLYGSLGER